MTARPHLLSARPAIPCELIARPCELTIRPVRSRTRIPRDCAPRDAGCVQTGPGRRRHDQSRHGLHGARACRAVAEIGPVSLGREHQVLSSRDAGAHERWHERRAGVLLDDGRALEGLTRGQGGAVDDARAERAALEGETALAEDG